MLQALQRSPELGAGPWLDLGTGSGAVALGLASILPKACQVDSACRPIMCHHPSSSQATEKSARMRLHPSIPCDRVLCVAVTLECL